MLGAPVVFVGVLWAAAGDNAEGAVLTIVGGGVVVAVGVLLLVLSGQSFGRVARERYRIEREIEHLRSARRAVTPVVMSGRLNHRDLYDLGREKNQSSIAIFRF